jgi:predicted PhzF superfamily epimerase YddE/YHI9
MAQPVIVVDAFTDTPFAGNPAAVCVLPGATSERWMQLVAAEMNLSETAFVTPRPDGDHDLRWFTPSTEVELCGHATLASAHVLGGEGRFHTRSGLLTCRRGDDGAVLMDFPAIPVEPLRAPPDWAPALGLPSGRVRGVWASDGGWVLVEVASAADVRAVAPDRAAILGLCGFAVVVAAPGDRPGVDSVCRVFGPAAGIDEDPVTGSAHCVIAPWLAARTGRAEFVGEQASARGGTVGMRLEGDRVVLSGRAVTVLEGVLRDDPPAA